MAMVYLAKKTIGWYVIGGASQAGYHQSDDLMGDDIPATRIHTTHVYYGNRLWDQIRQSPI